MTKEQLQQRLKDIHNEAVKTRKEIVKLRAPLKKLEGRLETAEYQLNCAINASATGNTKRIEKCNAKYKALIAEYEPKNKVFEELETRLNNLHKEELQVYSDISNILYYKYSEKCDKVVKDLITSPETRKERSIEYNEYIMTVVSHYRDIYDEKGEYVKRNEECSVEDFLDVIWRINRQVTYHGKDFRWKLVREIRYSKGRIYVAMSIPESNADLKARKTSAETDTCINLDIDWQWVESSDSMPEGIILFDVETDIELRIQLSGKWLNRTPC